MAGKIVTNSVVLGDSATDTQNFILKTNVDGTATLARGAAGTLGTVFGVNVSSAITGATLTTPTISSLTSASATALTLQSAGTTGLTIDTSQNLAFNSGYGSVATAYGCRAWVNFNGTGTVAIRASGNVSSITDGGVGVYTPNFTTAMPDVNYARVVNRGNSGTFFTSAGDDVTAPTVSAFRIGNRDSTGTYYDIDYIHVSVFR